MISDMVLKSDEQQACKITGSPFDDTWERPVENNALFLLFGVVFITGYVVSLVWPLLSSCLHQVTLCPLSIVR